MKKESPKDKTGSTKEEQVSDLTRDLARADDDGFARPPEKTNKLF